MYLRLYGFLPGDDEDDSLKFKLPIDRSFTEQIIKLLRHRDLNAMAEGEWLLTSEQVVQLSVVLGQPLPADLDLFIGVAAGRLKH